MKIAATLSVILAIVTSCWVYWGDSQETVGPEDKSGQLLNKKNEECVPEKVTFLRVASWDEENKEPKVFQVEKKDGRWIIPSHHDYPADGGTRVGETSGMVLNVRSGKLVTADPKQFADLGVIDPLKGGIANSEGRGKRVTLKDAGGAYLVDLIVGKKDEGADVYYVRDAASDIVYTAKINPDFSTQFKDWVETDPIKVSKSDIRSLDILDRDVVERPGARPIVKVKAQTSFKKPDGASDWTSPQTPKDKGANKDTIEKILSEIGGLKLVGVRPFIRFWLQKRGFYPTESDIVGNKGSVRFVTKDGLMHLLLFGEVALGVEEDKEADSFSKNKDAQKNEKKDVAKKAGDNRYMAIFTGYNPGFDEALEVDQKKLIQEQKKLEALGEKAGQPKDAEKEKKEDGKEKKEDIEKKIKELKEKVAKTRMKGMEKAQKKQKRFQQFFYVISDDTFKKLRPAPETLWKFAEIKKEELPGDAIPKDKDLEKGDDELQYFDLKEGAGDEVKDGDTVEVHYTGWLYFDKKQFDTSIGKAPLAVTIGKPGVNDGWQKGLKGMKLGGKRKLVVPPKLAYGDAGKGDAIPGDARLVFDIEVVKLTEKKDEKKAEKKEEKDAKIEKTEVKSKK